MGDTLWRNPASWRLLTLLFVLAVPIFLIASNVRWAFNDLRLYAYGFDKFNITTNTGISRDELMSAARQIRAYFNDDQEFLDVRVELGGVERSVFNRREVLHMRDVKGLVQGVYRVQEASAVYLLAFALMGFIVWRDSFRRRLARTALWGAVATLGAVALVGLLSLLGFDRLFYTFHVLSFSNDLWQLDPYRDYLLRMFPNGFWFDATLFIGLATIVEALLIGGLSWAALWRWRKAPQRTPAVSSTTETTPG